MFNKPYKPTGYSILVMAVFALGTGLLFFQYFYNRSLWLDEAMLALGIVNKDYGSLFLPLHPFPSATLSWLNTKIRYVFYYLLPVPDLPYCLMGSMYLFLISTFLLLVRKQFILLYVCFFPILIHLILSALKMYPIDFRLILYQTPLFILVISYGMYTLFQLFKRIPVLQYTLLFPGTLFTAQRLYMEYPMAYEEIRPVIRSVNQYIRPEHTVYVYSLSQPAFLYYSKIGTVQFGNARILYGKLHRGDNKGYLNELKNVQGPTWILFSHFYPFDGSRSEEKYIINALQQRGKLLKDFQAPGSAAYLFELQPATGQ